jgi:hypothetical protein
MDGGNMDVEVGIPVFSRISKDNRVELGSFPVEKSMGVTYTGL